MKGLTLGLILFSAVFAGEGKACTSHSCGSDVSVSIGIGYGYPGYGYPGYGYGYPGYGYNYGYGYGFGSYYGYRPFFFGRGAQAFRRSFRLQNRAMVAASNGNFGRAERLQARSNAAFWRGVRRGGGFGVRPYWL